MLPGGLKKYDIGFDPPSPIWERFRFFGQLWTFWMLLKFYIWSIYQSSIKYWYVVTTWFDWVTNFGTQCFRRIMRSNITANALNYHTSFSSTWTGLVGLFTWRSADRTTWLPLHVCFTVTAGRRRCHGHACVIIVGRVWWTVTRERSAPDLGSFLETYKKKTFSLPEPGLLLAFTD